MDYKVIYIHGQIRFLPTINQLKGENKAFFVAQLWKGVVLIIQKEQTGGNLAVKCVSTL